MSRRRPAPKGKRMKPTFFVFCEGKTEELYVKFLKSKYRIPIEIDTQVAKNGINANYIKQYKKQKFTHKNDKTFLFYDIDAPKMLEKLQAIDNTVLLYSNPCIELWFLLHLKEQKANISCNDCYKELKKRIKTYKKTYFSEELKDQLSVKYQKAANRAKKLSHFSNPSTNVWLLIEELKNVKNR
ncbi:MAG: RloB domain-containing protein [Chlorobi bacterium]|nr:RloB domain-containing protein [Chlorobiota bacterium]